MTFRARPVARRRGRAGWDSGDRRSALINAGFFLAIIVSVLILLGYGAYSWYNDHFGAVAVVNGQVITKDDLNNRLAIESFRLDYIESRIQTLMAKGRISASDGAQQVNFLNQRRQQLANLTLDRLVDLSLMGKLATDNGVAVSESDVDAQLVQEATTSAQRHVWMIEVEPDPNPETGQVGETEKRTALVKAQQALGRLDRGESWEDVARTVSSSGLAAQAGDLGWLSEDSGYDDNLMKAVFATDLNAPTGVIEGDDDVYRIGRATEAADSELDSTFEPQITDRGIKVADYRVAAGGDVLRRKLSEKVVADLGKPGAQRHVLEMYLPEPNPSTTPNEPGAKVRWIAFAPKDDLTAGSDLAADDPAWIAAKADADAAYAALKAHPETFDAKARAESDDPNAKNDGGKQDWIYASSTEAEVDQPVKNAVLADGVQPSQLLAPIKGEDAWYVVQYMRPLGEGDDAWLESLKTKATDEATFRQLAKDNSEGAEAKDGGDIGWVAKGQLEQQLDDAILATAVGSNSDVVSVTSDGTYLFRVLAEETRTPTEEQLKIFEDSGFSYWYTQQKDAADITYPGSSTGTE